MRIPFLHRTLAALALALGLAAAPARAQYAAQPAAGPPSSAPDTTLTIVLLTMGQGDMVWEKFGHNAVWIHDPAAGTDDVYNYGAFDFKSPGYWSRFIAGNWLYQLARSDINRTLFEYDYFKRAVWGQELNLTQAQARQVQQMLRINEMPQNREYLYDYFRDNCTTRVRDLLDRVLGGVMLARTGSVMTNTSYRWHSERLIADDRLSYFGLAGGLGPSADRRITAWEEMFLPFKLQEQVRATRIRAADGSEQPLVRREWTLLETPGRGPVRDAPPPYTIGFAIAGLLIAGLLAFLGRRARRSALARFGFAAVSTLWLLVAGIGGFVLVYLWTSTNHRIAYRNENILQLSPLALLLIVLVPCAAYGARWALRSAWMVAATVAALSVLGVVMQVLPGLDQRNAQMICLALPINLAIAYAVHGFMQAAPLPADVVARDRKRRMGRAAAPAR
ncbi:MAG TPA: DUF4105 domain-containing protein [Longimicrobium sp.]|jgi:hypothetical protein|uniref:lipoprotein N-acyltransferase Lnb domain-containing protein n=1 Tax=Longimicrobium sp. TaxID=2029185 RepID=UPI002ED87CFA